MAVAIVIIIRPRFCCGEESDQVTPKVEETKNGSSETALQVLPCPDTLPALDTPPPPPPPPASSDWDHLVHQPTSDYIRMPPTNLDVLDVKTYDTESSEHSLFMSGSDEVSSGSSEFLYKYKVLIICSPNDGKKEKIAVHELVARLHLWSELEVVSHDFVPHSKALSNWLMEELDKNGEDRVHAVLCVWTRIFKDEWEGTVNMLNSELVGAARTVIDNHGRKFKVATILLEDQPPDTLPLSLTTCTKIHISQIQDIVTFIKGVPSFSTH